jgi:hypothetical protein
MRINSGKIRKILGRVRTAPKRILKPFALKKHQDASVWMQHSQLFIWFRKSNKDFFSYTIFLVKKNKCEKILKLWENCYFIILSIHILKLEISWCDSPSPCWVVMAGASLRRKDREPAGYKSRPLSHAQADVVFRQWRLHEELALLLFPSAVWHPSRLH